MELLIVIRTVPVRYRYENRTESCVLLFIESKRSVFIIKQRDFAAWLLLFSIMIHRFARKQHELLCLGRSFCIAASSQL